MANTNTITDFWFYNKYKYLFRNNKVFILFSGGFDSRVLLELIVRSFKVNVNYFIYAVHVNHGVTYCSRMWERRCIDICFFFNIPILTICGTLRKNIVHSENSCRSLRSIVCNSFISQNSVVVTAHHGCDCAETVLQRLSRSTNSLSFSGIYYTLFGWEYLILRPLLYITKGALRLYAMNSKILWVEDYTNFSRLYYKRNFIRQHVLKTFQKNCFTLILTVLRLTLMSYAERINFLHYAYVNFIFVVDLTKYTVNLCRLFSVTSYIRFWIVRFWIYSLFFFMLSRSQYDILHYFLCKKSWRVTTRKKIRFCLFTINYDTLSILFLRCIKCCDYKK